MSCLNPLIRAVEQNDKVRIFSASEEDIREFPAVKASHHYKDYSIIPCGKCDGCRADYSRRWADRLMIESTLHDYNWFITLTFNDEWLKKQCEAKDDWYSLNKRHVQLFMKRLRREIAPLKVRFFACGEYGSKSNRPHYHLIIFGLEFPENDLVFLRKNNLGQDYFSSNLIAKCWSDPESGESYGFNVVGHVDYDSCRYVARYVMKKLNGPDKLLYEFLGVQEPFVLMSRRPGIGHDYMNLHPEWSEENLIYISTDVGSLAVPPPRYFENEIQKHDPDLYDLRKQFRRDMTENEWSGIRSMTNKSRYGYAKTLESNLKKSLEVLTSFETL